MLTLIKSVCVYNRGVKFYLLNKDYPVEWFHGINHKLSQIGSYIEDIKCTNENIKNYKTLGHIQSEATYFRYFISEFITEDVVLYLDADVIVNGNLQHVFNINLGNFYLAATTDYVAEKLHNIGQNYFNAGVLLINNKRWREEKIHDVLIEVSEQYANKVTYGDQDILNIVFHDKYLRLNRFFNYQMGGDFLFTYHHKTEYIENSEEPSLIIHFTSSAKPWLNGFETRFRDLYWYYFHLDWSEIINH